MVHIFEDELYQQLDQALEDTERLLKGGVDGLLVENYDWGYLDRNRAREEMAERLTIITAAVVLRSIVPVGVNILPNDYWQSLAVAFSTGSQFIQMDHVTGEFLGCESVNSVDYSTTRNVYPEIIVLGGIHPKYYELVDPTISLGESAKKAMALTEAVVVTGDVTGGKTSLTDLRLARAALGIHPLIVGSGLTPENAQAQLAIADGAIVGTALKNGGVCPGEPVSVDRVKRLMDEVVKFR